MTRSDDVLVPAVDPVGVLMIAGLALVAGPGAIVASIAILTHGFDPAAMSTFEWVATAIVGLVAVVMFRAGVQELRGGTGIRVDEVGVHQRGSSLAWPEIERVEAPGFGQLELHGAGKTLRLRTYLLRDARSLLDAIAERRGET